MILEETTEGHAVLKWQTTTFGHGFGDGTVEAHEFDLTEHIAEVVRKVIFERFGRAQE